MNRAAGVILTLGLAALAFSIAVSVSLGAADIKLRVVGEAIFRFDKELTEHQVIRQLRLPRVLGAALVGACFAVAGAIMQGMTRNPLADSGLLGLNAGAEFVLAVIFAFYPGMAYSSLILYSFLGAGLGAGVVYGIGSIARGGLTPVRLVLAGAAFSALLGALSQGIALYYRVGQDIARYYGGGLAGTTWQQLKIMAPWLAAALACAIVLSRSITLLSMGDDVARGLGLRTTRVKLAGMLIVLVLAGAAVSVAGAVGFIGLLVPHLTRKLVGVDYRWIIPCSAVLGGLLVVLADLAARTVHIPYETPVGALISLIGVPFFLYLARRERREL
ncbi:FecCD family ABC transporter permease [Cohnella fermenti]|uniref:FecCD family ABC transporter permease n=1 Tax=Cohnella fermenti TaxID=2565925 RepID=UPI001E4AEC03|nr:iron ABC transporter permease [Cohnella fermenti]